MRADDQRVYREQLKAQAENLMADVVALLTELIGSYPEQHTSAFHPKCGFSNSIQQLERIRKAIKKGRV